MHRISVIFFDLYKTLIHIPTNTDPYLRFFEVLGFKDERKFEAVSRITMTEEFYTFKEITKRLDVAYKEEMQDFFIDLEKEIAQAMNFKSENYVKKRKHNCKDKLVEMIKQDPRYPDLWDEPDT